MTNEEKVLLLQKAAPRKRKNKKKTVSLDSKKGRAGWLFVLPFVIGFILVYLPIIFDSIRYSFMTIKTLKGGGFETTFVGWDNYRTALFGGTGFTDAILSGIQQLLFDIPAIVIFSLFMAVLLNENIFGRAAFRAIFFVPVILSTGLIDSIDQNNGLLAYMTDTSSSIDTGAGADSVTQIVSSADLSFLFENMQIGSGLTEYVTGIINNIYGIINRSGVQMLIFLAGLQSISPAIYESCSIDGASAWETFWKISLPMISPMILVNAIYTIIDSFTSASNVVMSFIDSAAGGGGNGSVLGSAMSWVYFLIVIAIIALATMLISAFVFYQKRDA